VLGLEIKYQQGDKFVSFLFSNDVRLGIKKAVEEREIPGAQTIFIQSQDAKADFEKFKAKGIHLPSDVEEKVWGNVFRIFDPDGNKIMFVEKK
jgi:predicted enzyme related to lactoylglutathione lyase